MTDEKIVSLYWERNERAIAETELAYGRYFHAVAYGILSNHEDAKEMKNDAYLRAWNSIPPTKPRSLKAFLTRIVRQLSLNRLEYKNAEKRIQNTLALDELYDCIGSDGQGSVEDEVILCDFLNRFLRSLDEVNRIVFLRRYWYLCSVEDIAQGMGFSEGKVKSMLFRIRKKLQKQLQKEGFTV